MTIKIERWECNVCRFPCVIEIHDGQGDYNQDRFSHGHKRQFCPVSADLTPNWHKLEDTSVPEPTAHHERQAHQPRSIAANLLVLAMTMREVAMQMSRHENELFQQHAEELRGASMIADEWADEIREIYCI